MDSIQNILKNNIHLIDCMELLKQLPDGSVDCVITDPPYMTTALKYDLEACGKLDMVVWFKEIIRVAKDNTPIVIFTSGKFTYQMMHIGKKYYRYDIIWLKNNITGGLDSHVRPLRCHENILVFTKTLNRETVKYNHGVLFDKNVNVANSTIIANSIHGEGEGVKNVLYKRLNDVQYPKSCIESNKNSHNIPQLSHPSEKPFELVEKLVKMYSNEGDLVLDTFGGSGVVAHVCKYHKRDFIVCEIDIKYYNMSITRLNSDMLI